MEIWEKWGYKTNQAFYEAYPEARRKDKASKANKPKRKRKFKRAIIKHGKIIAAPPNMIGKYQLEGTLHSNPQRREELWQRRLGRW